MKVANFRPFFLAINAAGIEVLAIPKIIMVIGKVAREGSLAMLVDNIAPIKTIIGDADIANGCAINNSQIFRGNLMYLANTKVVKTKSIRAKTILENIKRPVRISFIW